MRRCAWCLVVLFAWPLAGQAAKPAPVEFGAGAWVDVDATGKAHVVEMDRLTGIKDDGDAGSSAATVKARLRERIESWEFQPPMKNGVAVSGKTHVWIALVGEDNGSGGIVLRIKSAGTGSQILRKPSMMPIAREVEHADGWRLLVHMTIDQQGRVTDAGVVESKAFDGRTFTPRASDKLVKATVKTVMQFEFVPELVDGQPVSSEGNMPIVICMSKACMKAGADPAQDRNDHEFVAAKPSVLLRTAVAETAL